MRVGEKSVVQMAVVCRPQKKVETINAGTPALVRQWTYRIRAKPV